MGHTAPMLLLALACSDYELVDEPDVTEPIVELGPPDIEVAPGSVDFGVVQATVDQVTAVVEIQNLGDQDLVLEDLFVDHVAFDVTYTGAPLVGQGQVVEAIVAFAPQQQEAYEGTLFIDSNDPDEPTVEVPLSGDTLRPELTLTPAEHDFGALLLGESDAVTLTLENIGEAPADVTLEYTPSSPELSIAGLADGTLDAGAAQILVVTYAPTDTTPDEASLVVTSDTQELLAIQTGSGEDPIVEYAVQIELTADDAWEGWIDGVAMDAGLQGGWSSTGTYDYTLESGTHVFAVHATDQAAVIAGFIASVRVDGSTEVLTGGGDWVFSASSPSSSWTDPAFDDSSWSAPYPCGDTSPWGSAPSSLLTEGAVWVWHDSNCRALGESWYRLVLELP